MENKQKIIFIVGGAGYVGEMLCEQLGKRSDVAKLLVLDKEPQSEYNQNLPKVVYIKSNMADNSWREQVAEYQPEVVIHTAWQIRALYGQSNKQWHDNVEGSRRVFEFAFKQPSVKKLIYFSTASSYSARSDNHFDYLFTEAVGFRDDDYLYAKEKKATEEVLREMYDEAKQAGSWLPQVTVVRPAAITGPRGRYMRIRFGLQSALQGKLKGGAVNTVINALTSFVPTTPKWVRQFIHEDDVNDVITKFTFETMPWDYEVFNLTPPGEPVYAADMATAVGKKQLPIYPWMARLAFFGFWHLTRGRVPTAPGSWRFYSYPVVMDGKKLAGVYTCRYSSKDAFRYTDGRYEDWVPKTERKSNS